MMLDAASILCRLPGKDCGLCGVRTCADFAEVLLRDASAWERCIHVKPPPRTTPLPVLQPRPAPQTTWRDFHGREFDFILDSYPNDPGPRETIILFNPINVERLKVKKGDVLYGRPGWISCGCPVTHVGQVVEEPDYFNGTVVWCVVGPLAARERGINIGCYNTTAYEGIVRETRIELKLGVRYYFQPRCCMLQWRHCGLINTIGRTKDGLRVRIEGLWIG